jgi:hypothetical protein
MSSSKNLPKPQNMATIQTWQSITENKIGAKTKVEFLGRYFGNLLTVWQGRNLLQLLLFIFVKIQKFT